MARTNFSTGPRVSLAERFWAKVEKRGPDECWLWQGSFFKRTRYGQIGVKGRNRSAHTVAYELTKGPIPAGKVVRHTCDVHACVNPAHLLLGTHLDNTADMWERGRARPTAPRNPARGTRQGTHTKPETRRRGETNGIAKLTEGQVREMRARYAAGGIKQRDLAAAYGLSQATVWAILHRKGWAHVE